MLANYVNFLSMTSTASVQFSPCMRVFSLGEYQGIIYLFEDSDGWVAMVTDSYCFSVKENPGENLYTCSKEEKNSKMYVKFA